jgi:hypothetical protein
MPTRQFCLKVNLKIKGGGGRFCHQSHCIGIEWH